ncbi:MAG: hypothetical protein HYV07_27405 [Deltaproteobacteria bacterium]|nr:hypothetical protein [Deltaproteobacteria bacterium]
MSARGLALVVSLSACAGPKLALRSVAPLDAAALDAAAERFYTSTSAADLRAAVRAAESAGPQSATYHELAAELAMLESNSAERFKHLVLALEDSSNPAATLHLELLTEVAWTFDERDVVERLCETLATRHPSPEVRAFAAAQLALLDHHRGDLRASKSSREKMGHELAFAIVGVWDNDQGKGFDSELPPESSITFDAKYDGVVGEIEWRTRPPTELGSADLNFSGLFYPNQWALGFATAVVEAKAATKAELRLRTSSPIRVFLNGRLIFEVRNVGGRTFDQLILPVDLPAGRSRLLVKTAAERGAWRLGGRVTCHAGVICPGLEVLPPETNADAKPPASVPALSERALIDARVGSINGEARRAAHRILWSRAMGLFGPAVELSDSFLASATRSLYGGFFLAASLWDRGERDRTADLVDTLDRVAGAELPAFALQHARFMKQEGLGRKARKAVTSLIAKRPELEEAHMLLASLHEKEGWREDQCAELAETARLRPGLLEVEHLRADCLKSLGFLAEATAIRRRILDKLPFDSTSLAELETDAGSAGRLDEATELAASLTRAFPAMPWTWIRLGEDRRRAGDPKAAAAAFARAKELAPDGPRAHEALGALSYQLGDRARAISEWQLALTKNPEDERLSNRLAYLAPSGGEPWEKDMPSEDEIDTHVAARAVTPIAPGANVLDLLDHQVSRINADGSSSHYVTIISHALNDAGRDQITQQSVPAGGRFRILHAFAIDPSGRRIQASSIRGRSIRYRGLSVGSTVVLQFRQDQPPRPYLSRHYAEDWWFQGPSSQRRKSQWIVWLPKGAVIHESIGGADQRCVLPDGSESSSCFDVKRTQEEIEKELRVSWTAENVPPLVGEPSMPPTSDSMFHLSFSTVPGWDEYLKWEVALLEDVFRESPELNATAERLEEGLTTTSEKVERIHRHLMQNVRYQQDYEDTIAGVKPHAAPVVIERAYGDCKDKAVLFIALARRMGIEVHYALLRTRTAGALERDVPMQQFNHAIVYVPAQAGFPEGRFYDPTADALDVDVLRDDDPGSVAMVLDPRTKTHRFIEIPYQPPSAHSQRFESTLEVDVDGRGIGQLSIESRGRFGQLLRNLARNDKQLAQGAQYFMGTLFSGARVHEQRVVESQDLTKPARLEIAFEAPAVGRVEGNELRIALPSVWSPQGAFQLADRRFPLLLGTPYSLSWLGEVVLPEALSLKLLPSPVTVEAECFRFERKYSAAGRRVTVEQAFTTKCERIGISAYNAHREAAESVVRASREEIVATVGRGI